MGRVLKELGLCTLSLLIELIAVTVAQTFQYEHRQCIIYK